MTKKHEADDQTTGTQKAQGVASEQRLPVNDNRTQIIDRRVFPRHVHDFDRLLPRARATQREHEATEPSHKSPQSTQNLMGGPVAHRHGWRRRE
jgi:hypothetical protein